MSVEINKTETDTGKLRTFTTGATRDTSQNKPDYEGFLSPLALERFGQYMHKHRHQSDGGLRDSDNWQKGIPMAVYVKSLWRHMVSLWTLHRGLPARDEKGQPCDVEEMCCAIMFNIQGYLHEHLKKKQNRAWDEIIQGRNLGGLGGVGSGPVCEATADALQTR